MEKNNERTRNSFQSIKFALAMMLVPYLEFLKTPLKNMNNLIFGNKIFNYFEFYCVSGIIFGIVTIFLSILFFPFINNHINSLLKQNFSNETIYLKFYNNYTFIISIVLNFIIGFGYIGNVLFPYVIFSKSIQININNIIFPTIVIFLLVLFLCISFQYGKLIFTDKFFMFIYNRKCMSKISYNNILAIEYVQFGINIKYKNQKGNLKTITIWKNKKEINKVLQILGR